MAARTTVRRSVTTVDDGPSQREVMSAAVAATAAATAASVAATGASTAAIAASAAAAAFAEQFKTIGDRLLRVEEHRAALDDDVDGLGKRMDRLESSVEGIDGKLDDIIINQQVSKRGVLVLEWIIGIVGTIALALASIHELLH